MTNPTATQENEQAEETTAKPAKHHWNKFSVTTGMFMLGSIVAIAAFGLYMAQPFVKMEVDIKGVESYVRCAGSMNVGQVDEEACRSYYEDYLPVSIENTDNLPKIVPIELIGGTYLAAQAEFAKKGVEEMKPLDQLTKGKIQLLKSGKAVHSTQE